MSKFLLLTDVDSIPANQQVIINRDNIGVVYTERDNNYIELIYSRGSDRYPKTIHVKESFEQLKNLLE